MVSSLLLDPSPQPQCSAVEGYILQRVHSEGYITCSMYSEGYVVYRVYNEAKGTQRWEEKIGLQVTDLPIVSFLNILISHSLKKKKKFKVSSVLQALL